MFFALEKETYRGCVLGVRLPAYTCSGAAATNQPHLLPTVAAATRAGATGAPWGGAGGPAGSAVLSRSETLPAARQLQALVAAAAQQKLAGSCRFAFCFLDKRGGTGGGSSSFRG